MKLRKYVATVEETLHDFGPVLARPVTKAVVGGVIANPYAGRHEADIQPMMKALEPLAVEGGFYRRTWLSPELRADGRPTGSSSCDSRSTRALC